MLRRLNRKNIWNNQILNLGKNKLAHQKDWNFNQSEFGVESNGKLIRLYMLREMWNTFKLEVSKYEPPDDCSPLSLRLPHRIWEAIRQRWWQALTRSTLGWSCVTIMHAGVVWAGTFNVQRMYSWMSGTLLMGHSAHGRTRRSWFRDLVKTKRNQIVFTIFRLIWSMFQNIAHLLECSCRKRRSIIRACFSGHCCCDDRGISGGT